MHSETLKFHSIESFFSFSAFQVNIDVPTTEINDRENREIDENELPTLKDFENGSFNVDNIILSRTLKRKFNELEEISQRLKSRLLDVTDAAGNFDVDDEFENDLNTCPNEDDVNGDFDWNRFSNLEIDCGQCEPDDVDAVDGDDFSADSLKHPALSIGQVDSNGLAVDGTPATNVQGGE